MRIRACMVFLAVCVSACDGKQGDGLVAIAPTSVAATTPTSGPAADPVVSGPTNPPAVTVTGPFGCAERRDLPEVLEWNVANMPAGARLVRGYHWDDTVNCEATEQQQRTENGHLRWNGIDLVEFDTSAVKCYGRIQADFHFLLDGKILDLVVNGELRQRVTLVIKNSDGPKCQKSVDPPVEEPVVPVPLVDPRV